MKTARDHDLYGHEESRLCVSLLYPCLSSPILVALLPSQLGNLEVGVNACSMPQWKQQRGGGPTKTYSLVQLPHNNLPVILVQALTSLSLFLFSFLTLCPYCYSLQIPHYLQHISNNSSCSSSPSPSGIAAPTLVPQKVSSQIIVL